MSRYAETDSQRYLWHIQQVRRKKRARRREEPEPVGPEAIGGTETVINPEPNVFYRVHSFTDVGESVLTVNLEIEVEYLVVGGGGSGGFTSDITWHSPGGGGEVLQGTIANVGVSTYLIVVGAGGAAGARETGASSSAIGITAIGGGAGDLQVRNYQAGDSGSGNAGGTRLNQSSGGGGGDSAAGQNAISISVPGAGGDGTLSIIDGQSLYYGGGGGGRFSTTYANEGLGGPSRASSGGGQGHAGTATLHPARSGIVIVRYRISEADYLAGL